MIGAAGSSKSPFVGFLVQLLISAAVTCGLSFWGLFITQFFLKNKLKTLYVSLIITGVCYIISLSLFLAMFYSKAKKMTEYTNVPSGYWILSTGSKIAFYEYGEQTNGKNPFVLLHGGPGAPVSGEEHFVHNLSSLGYKSYQMINLDFKF